MPRKPLLRLTVGLVGLAALGSFFVVPGFDRGVATRERATTTDAGDGASLVWSDEFDGTALNTSVWEPYHNTYGHANNNVQCNTPDNVVVSGGTLKINAKRQTVTCSDGSSSQFTSGFLGTRETGTYFPRYGRFEIRARVPHGQGLWPAFWLRHRDGARSAEVDIMEYFHSQFPGMTTQTLHLDGRSNPSKRNTFVEPPTTTPGWHTWTVDITPAATGVTFTFSVDGTSVHTYTDTQHAWASTHTGENLWDIAVNLAVGGNWAGHPDDVPGYLRDLNRCAQGGTAPNACITTGIRRAVLPATYEIDYVRVYDSN